ncbi:hypothetical protein OROMI_025500 [Orobanche minor]
MVTVKRYGRGHGDSSLGKPALHPATVDLKGEGIVEAKRDKVLVERCLQKPGRDLFNLMAPELMPSL